MTWREWLAARQLLAEEFVGSLARQAGNEEEEAMARAKSVLARERPLEV